MRMLRACTHSKRLLMGRILPGTCPCFCHAVHAEAAYRLYLAAQVAPGTHTLRVIKRELNLSADGAHVGLIEVNVRLLSVSVQCQVCKLAYTGML